jgi:hypothetical protein
MENNPKVSQNIYGNVGNNAGNVEGDFNPTGTYNFSSGNSKDEIAQVLAQILEQIINKNTLAAQKSAQEAVNRLPVLKDPQVIDVVVSNSPTLRDRFQSAIAAMGIEMIKLIFAPAGIPIEGFKAWINPG